MAGLLCCFGLDKAKKAKEGSQTEVPVSHVHEPASFPNNTAQVASAPSNPAPESLANSSSRASLDRQKPSNGSQGPSQPATTDQSQSYTNTGATLANQRPVSQTSIGDYVPIKQASAVAAVAPDKTSLAKDSLSDQSKDRRASMESLTHAASGTTLSPAGFQTMTPLQLSKEVQQLGWVGHGGYGAVYKGVWQGASVAVKFTVTDYLDLQGASAHEAVLSKILSHPNVVQTFASRIALLDEGFLRKMFDGDVNLPSRESQAAVDSFRSGEGFGSPYGLNASISFKDVLTHIGAKPGHYITQVIMEFCDRGSLHQAIAKGLFKSSSKWNNKIALRALLRTAREIAQGMSHLHTCRVVHGDLKPGNVLLMSSRADRRGFIAKVSDFGLSTYCMASHISVSRWSTVSYMAPEAFDGHLAMASDVYSFGVMTWEMYTGRQPFAGMQPAQVVMGVQEGQLRLEWPPDSDQRIVSLVEQCIQRNPANRPTFLELIEQLTQLEAQVRMESSNREEAAPLSADKAGAGSSARPPVNPAGVHVKV